MNHLLSILIAVTLTLTSSSVLAGEPPLSLTRVLRSLTRTHPTIEEARQLVLAARGDRLASEGAFDPKVQLGAKGQPLGTYDKGQLEALVTQVTPWWGVSFFAGWRRGFGSFALYDGDLETLSGGEFSTGFSAPLWRDGPIDAMRARMQQADFDVLSSKQKQRFVTLLLQNAAAHAYWNWVEAGQLLRVNQSLLEVASTRNAGLKRRIEKGDAAEILGVDNERILLDRRAKVVLSRQKVEQAAVKLSLYLRDAEGEPVRIPAQRLPDTLPTASPPSQSQLQRDIRHALRNRPDIALFSLAEQRQQVEAELQDNRVGPRIDLHGWLAKDFGTGKDELRPLDLGIGLTVEIPLLLRKERGKRNAARAKLAAAKQKTRLGRDKVEAEIRVAHAAVVAASEVVVLARQQRIAAERMAAAERRRFELGETDLLSVNLRELSAAKAWSDEIEARANFQRARADYRTAAARSPNP